MNANETHWRCPDCERSNAANTRTCGFCGQERPLAQTIACIRREFLGGSEDVTYEEFALYAIQDDEVARRVAEELIRLHPESYWYGEDEPRTMERFTLLDKAALQRQIRRDEQAERDEEVD